MAGAAGSLSYCCAVCCASLGVGCMHTHNSGVAETHRQNGGRETDVYRKYGDGHIICFLFSGCYGFQQSKDGAPECMQAYKPGSVWETVCFYPLHNSCILLHAYIQVDVYTRAYSTQK